MSSESHRTPRPPIYSCLRLAVHRRLIGRRFDDPTVKKDMESWPFKVVDEDGNTKIEEDYLGSRHKFSPQEISAMVLTKVSQHKKRSNTHNQQNPRPTNLPYT